MEGGRRTSAKKLLLVSVWGVLILSWLNGSLAFTAVGSPRNAVTGRRLASKHGRTSSTSSTSLHAMMILPSHIEQLCQTYSYCLVEHQLATQSATAGLFAGIGDVLAQTVIADNDTNEKRRPYDARRTAHFVLKGLGGGLMWNAWFQVSDPISLSIAEKVLGISDASVVTAASEVAVGAASVASAVVDPTAVTWLLQALRVMICIVLEQCFVSPLFYTIWDIPVPALLSGSPVRQLPAQIQSKLGPLLLANAKVWTPANCITYNLPPEWRVLFASCTDLVWQVVCSRITTSEIEVPLPVSSSLPASTLEVVLPSENLVPSTSERITSLNAEQQRLAKVSSTELRALVMLQSLSASTAAGSARDVSEPELAVLQPVVPTDEASLATVIATETDVSQTSVPQRQRQPRVALFPILSMAAKRASLEQQLVR